MTAPRYPGLATLSAHAGHVSLPYTDTAVAMLETRIAALENGVGALACASPQAALHLALTTLAEAGSHVVAASSLDGALHGLLAHGLRRFGVETTFVDARDPNAWRAAIRAQTCVLVAPLMGGPGLDLLDLSRIGALAHEHHLPLLVDATLATPWLLQPLEHGADLVLHAAGSYLGGRGNGTGGLLVDGGTFDWQRAHDATGRFAGLCESGARYDGLVYSEASTVGAFSLRARREGLLDFGAALSPFDAAAILHDIETLGLRMERHVANARRVAAFLAAQATVESVEYPELDGHPGRALAGALMPRGCGAVVGMRLGSAAAGQRFLDALRLFAPAADIGGARSRAAAPDAGADGLRLSIGLEDADDLIDDLARALKLAGKGS